MICIYKKTNTDYTKNGDAVLIPVSAELELTINGAWQLKLEHPYDPEERYKLLIDGNIIRADIKCINELEAVQQRFRIYYFSRNLHSVEVIAFPVAMESNFDAPIDNLIIQNKTGAAAMADLQAKIGTSKYNLSTDVSATGSSSWSNTNIHTALAGGDEKSFLKVWGGEIVYDNNNIKVKTRLGDATAGDHKITYGDNLTNIEYKKDDSGVTTRIYPISQDGIRLNGTGYVDSPNHAGDYPVAHCRYFTAPYTIVDTDPSSPTNTRAQTAAAVTAVSGQASTDLHAGEAAATGAGLPPEYLKAIRQNILDAVKTTALAGISSAPLYNVLAGAIDSAGAFLAELEQPEWGWMGSDETGWKYGNQDGYAKNEYIRIGKKWSYFGNDGNWQEPRDDSAAWDWHQGSGTGKKYGNFNKYYAHNEFVYITESGTLKEYWFNEQGWYESDESGDSDWDWHGSGTAEDPWWFGETDAGDNKNKYAHDCWLFINGTLYFFDSNGYYDGSTKFENYQWDWVESDERFWFGNDENHDFAAVYLTSQWANIGGTWYYFDANGYAESTNDSIARAIAYFTAAITGTTSTVTTQKTALYNLLYSNMTAWALKRYTQGKIDLPTVTITVNMADLSKTTEYKGFEHLQTIKLGDSVECTDTVHGISTTNRVIGLTYDILREYNAEVVIGSAAATVGQILGSSSGQAVAGGFDTSALEAQISATQTSIGQLQQSKQDKLTAGDNITIVNNRISATGGAGLQYWTETEKKFYNVGTIPGISSLPAYKRALNNEIGNYPSGYGWFRCMVTRVSTSNDPVIMGYTADSKHPMLVYASTEEINDFKWGWSDNKMNPPFGVAEWNDKSTYPLYVLAQQGATNYFGYSTGTVNYNGTVWHILLIDCYYWDGGGAVSGDISRFEYGWGNNPSAAGLALLEAAHAAPTTQVTMEIATEGDIVKYYTEEKTIIDIDDEGNALVKEITTAAGSLTSQMAAKQNLLTAGDNININGDTISATDTTYDDFAGATAQEAGTAGLVPAPETTENNKFLKGDGTWATPSGGTEVEANPAETATSTLLKLKVDGTVYGVSGGGGGGSFVGLTKSEYEALTQQEKEDTSKLYFVQEGGGTTETVDIIGASTDWAMYREGRMTITWSNDQIIFDWLGSSSIGANIVKIAKIPATVNKIKFKITTGNSYATDIERFKIGVGVRTTYSTGVILNGYNTSDWLAFKDFNTRNDVWEDYLDLTNILVDTYLYIIGHGWDMTINYLEEETPSTDEASYYTYWNNAKRSEYNQFKELTQAEYNALTPAQKSNGKLYFTHDGGYDFFNYDNGKIVVRTNTTTGERIWFFNGFTKTADDMDIPAELVPYLPQQTQAGQVALTWAWTDDTSTTREGAIGFLYPGTSSVKIRSWNNNYSTLMGGTFWGTLIIDDAGEQHNNYSAPDSGLTLEPNRIYLNGRLYAECTPT